MLRNDRFRTCKLVAFAAVIEYRRVSTFEQGDIIQPVHPKPYYDDFTAAYCDVIILPFTIFTTARAPRGQVAVLEMPVTCGPNGRNRLHATSLLQFIRQPVQQPWLAVSRQQMRKRLKYVTSLISLILTSNQQIFRDSTLKMKTQS